MALTTLVELKDYIFRKLGSEVHTVEITDLQWGDILQDAQDEFYEYSDDASLEKLIVIPTLGQREFLLDSNILAITECYNGLENAILGNNELLINTRSIQYQLLTGSTNDIIDIASYVITRSWLDMIKTVTREYLVYGFNPESKRLWIGQDTEEFIITALVKEPIEDLLNTKFFKMLVEAKTLRQWARNIDIKYKSDNTQIIGNGMALNAEQMRAEAEIIEEQIKDGIEEDEWGSILTPRKTR